MARVEIKAVILVELQIETVADTVFDDFLVGLAFKDLSYTLDFLLCVTGLSTTALISGIFFL